MSEKACELLYVSRKSFLDTWISFNVHYVRDKLLKIPLFRFTLTCRFVLIAVPLPRTL